MIRIFALLLFFLPFAHAQEQDAQLAYNSGDYSVAAALAEANGDVDALAFAARAVLAEAMSMETGQPEKSTLQRAEALSRRVILEDKSHVEARLQLAISLSLQARPMSNRRAMRSGLGQESRKLAEDILESDPGNTYANGLLAIWNVEVLRRGGRLGGQVMGASVPAGREHYEVAAATSPE